MFHGNEAKGGSSAPEGGFKEARKREKIAWYGLKVHLLLPVLWQLGTLWAKVPPEVIEVPGQITSLGFIPHHFTCSKALPMRSQSLDQGPWD